MKDKNNKLSTVQKVNGIWHLNLHFGLQNHSLPLREALIKVGHPEEMADNIICDLDKEANKEGDLYYLMGIQAVLCAASHVMPEAQQDFLTKITLSLVQFLQGKFKLANGSDTIKQYVIKNDPKEIKDDKTGWWQKHAVAVIAVAAVAAVVVSLLEIYK